MEGFVGREASATPLPCRCHAVAMLLPCYCHGIAMPLPYGCHALAMLLPRYCHLIAMPSSVAILAQATGSSDLSQAF